MRATAVAIARPFEFPMPGLPAIDLRRIYRGTVFVVQGAMFFGTNLALLAVVVY